MGFVKIAAAILIFGSGLIGSYFIIKNSGPILPASDLSDLRDESKLVKDLLTGKNPIQWAKESSNKPASALDSFQVLNNGEIANFKNESNENLTKLVASSIFSGMRQMDEENKNPSGYFNPSNPSDSNSKKAVEAALSNLKDPLSFLNISISDGDLKISPDNSKEFKINYLKSTADIIMNNSNEFFDNPLKALEKLIYGDASALNKVINSYAEIYKGFLSISAPSDWLGLHKSYLEILGKTELVYRGMADFQNDPIKASLLGEALPQIVKAEAKIREEYYQKEIELRN